MQRYYSKIYWHFTGSPENVNWHEIKVPKDLKNCQVKSTKQSFDILEAILTSSKLKATCTERVSSTEETEPFCCVCDIPIKDLIYHKKYYGDCAIGFRAEAIHKNFTPVLYINLEYAKLIDENRMLDTNKTFEENDSAELLLEYLFGLNRETFGVLSNFLKITNFSENEDETFYREREWRCLGDFNFEEKDVAAIVVPQEYLTRAYKMLMDKNLRDVSVLSWELIEKA